MYVCKMEYGSNIYSISNVSVKERDCWNLLLIWVDILYTFKSTNIFSGLKLKKKNSQYKSQVKNVGWLCIIGITLPPKGTKQVI